MSAMTQFKKLHQIPSLKNTPLLGRLLRPTEFDGSVLRSGSEPLFWVEIVHEGHLRQLKILLNTLVSLLLWLGGMRLHALAINSVGR